MKYDKHDHGILQKYNESLFLSLLFISVSVSIS